MLFYFWFTDNGGVTVAQVLHIAYHHIWRPEDGPKPGKDVCKYERFLRQMEFLRRNEWQVLTCGEFVERIRKDDLPEKVATLSFDDGLSSQYTHAYPALLSFGIPATFFIIACALEDRLTPGGRLALLAKHKGTGWIKDQMKEILLGTFYGHLLSESFPLGSFYEKEKDPEMRRIKIFVNRALPLALRDEITSEMLKTAGLLREESAVCRRDFLNWAKLVEMEMRGMEIGSHSFTHPFMGELSVLEAVEEFSKSADTTFLRTGARATSFAWPIGGIIPARILTVAGDFYRSAWNYSMTPVHLGPPYVAANIQRVDETCFEQVTGATL